MTGFAGCGPPTGFSQPPRPTGPFSWDSIRSRGPNSFRRRGCHPNVSFLYCWYCMIDVGRRIGAKDMACRMMTRAACVTNYRKRSITYYSSALFPGRSGSEHCASCIGKQPPPLSKLTPSLIGGMAQGNVSPKMIASVLILSWSCYAGSSGKKGIIGHLIVVSEQLMTSCLVSRMRLFLGTRQVTNIWC